MSASFEINGAGLTEHIFVRYEQKLEVVTNFGVSITASSFGMTFEILYFQL